MKLYQKIASAFIFVFALTTVIAPKFVYAATDVVDFENGNFDAFTLKMESDSDKSILSVVDFNGSKALKVDVQDANKVPKLQFNVHDLVDESKLNTIQTLEFDLVIVNPDGKPVGTFGGGVGSEGLAHAPAWSQEDWTIQDDVNSITKVTKITRTFKKDTEKFINNVKGCYLLMRWAGNANDMYIDNVRLLDANGNPIELKIVSASENAVPKTGSASNAVYLFAGAVIMIAGVLAVKKKGNSIKSV